MGGAWRQGKMKCFNISVFPLELQLPLQYGLSDSDIRDEDTTGICVLSMMDGQFGNRILEKTSEGRVKGVQLFG